MPKSFRIFRSSGLQNDERIEVEAATDPNTHREPWWVLIGNAECATAEDAAAMGRSENERLLQMPGERASRFEEQILVDRAAYEGRVDMAANRPADQPNDQRVIVMYASPCACPMGGYVLDRDMGLETPKPPPGWSGRFYIPIVCDADAPAYYSETPLGSPLPVLEFMRAINSDPGSPERVAWKRVR